MDEFVTQNLRVCIIGAAGKCPHDICFCRVRRVYMSSVGVPESHHQIKVGVGFVDEIVKLMPMATGIYLQGVTPHQTATSLCPESALSFSSPVIIAANSRTMV